MAANFKLNPMKQLVLSLFALLMMYVYSSNAQPVIIPKDVRFLVDSATKQQLVESLNQFLAQKESPNKANPYVLPADLPAMSALLDELKGIDKNNKLKDDRFYKPVLENLIDAGNGRLTVQFAYLGYGDGAPALRASFRLMAVKENGHYCFYTVLKQNTAGWKLKRIDFGSFYYRDSLNLKEARAYIDFLAACNKRLKVKAEPVIYYDCANYPDALQLLGIDYKLDYSGIRYDGLVGHENNQTITLIGGYTDKSRFDRHDLWHDRLHMVLSTDKINRPVDEGCAYLYGGSWGKTWPEVLALFKEYAAGHPDADWVKLYAGSNNFYLDGNKPFILAYAINALIVQKIEKERGFEPVLELLGCGKRVTGDDNYFKALEKVSGITVNNFNKSVWELLKKD
jgi:hypothetical protein